MNSRTANTEDGTGLSSRVPRDEPRRDDELRPHDELTRALEEALEVSRRLTTLLGAPTMEPLRSNVGLRLARAHSLAALDQLTDLLKHPPTRR